MAPVDMHVKPISPLISLLSCEGPIFINIGCRYIVSRITIIVSILSDLVRTRKSRRSINFDMP